MFLFPFEVLPVRSLCVRIDMTPEYAFALTLLSLLCVSAGACGILSPVEDAWAPAIRRAVRDWAFVAVIHITIKHSTSTSRAQHSTSTASQLMLGQLIHYNSRTVAQFVRSMNAKELTIHLGSLLPAPAPPRGPVLSFCCLSPLPVGPSPHRTSSPAGTAVTRPCRIM